MNVPFLLFITFLLVQASTQHSIHPRISNGMPTAINEFTFVASIRMSFPFKPYFHLCHGVVIDELWILSTRICVKATTLTIGRFRIIVGLYYTLLDYPANQPEVQTLQIADRYIYDADDTSDKPNNIGLFKVDKKIANGTVVKLSQPGSNPTGELLMLGWGHVTEGVWGERPVQLQQANVTILTKSTCARIFWEYGLIPNLQNTQICVNSAKNRISACIGDSGVPMIRYVNNEPEVVAIVSWNIYPCMKASPPTIGTFVAPFIRWIRDTMRTSANPITDKDISEDDYLTSPLLVAH